jgi:hypothetical protein
VLEAEVMVCRGSSLSLTSSSTLLVYSRENCKMYGNKHIRIEEANKTESIVENWRA